MNIDTACVDCIIVQSLRVADAIKADEALRTRMLADVKTMAKGFDFTQSPPEVATDVYAHLSKLAQKPDLYREHKRQATEHARTMIPALRERVNASDDPLHAAVKVAVAGNVIDLASEVTFDLDEEIRTIFDTTFAHDDFAALAEALASAKTLLYLADNAGEHLFDALAIETIAARFPELKIYYMTRGAPIINDVTFDEARADGLDAHATLMDSGVDTPGFVYGRANAVAQKLFDRADVVIAKGMGNYETLSPAPRPGICHLLKVKCSVVARAIDATLGDIICKMA